MYIAIWFGRLLALLLRTVCFVVRSKCSSPRVSNLHQHCVARRKGSQVQVDVSALRWVKGAVAALVTVGEKNRSKQFSSSLRSCGDGELGMSPTLHGAAMREHVLRAMQSLRRSSVHVSLIAAAMDAAC